MTWRARRNIAHFCAEQGRGNSLAAQDGHTPTTFSAFMARSLVVVGFPWWCTPRLAARSIARRVADAEIAQLERNQT